jgi:peptide/nickel transport system substrate-binding protein
MATLAVAALSLSPLSPGATRVVAATSSSPTTLTVAAPGEVDSMNPFVAEQAVPTMIHRFIYDFLTNYSPKDDSPVPGLASSWRVSRNKLTWTYIIRSGATWSDGVPVTAHDVAWTYNLMMTNPTAATANGTFVTNFKSVTAPNNTTLVIRLKQPQSTMLALDVPIVPEHIWKRHVKDIGTFTNETTPVVGDGPFIMTGYKTDQYIILKANPTYWRGAPKFKEIIFRYYKDTDAAIEALRKGEVDLVTDLTATQYNSLNHAKHITQNDGPGKRFYALAMNPGATTSTGKHFGSGNPALRNLKVRQAIMMGIDKRTLVTKVLGGYGQVGAGYIPPIFPNYRWSPSRSEALTFDPAKAKALLTSAGYPLKNGVRMTPRGKPLTLRLLGQSSRDMDAEDATYVQEWLKALGITVHSSIVSSDQMSTEEEAGDYDLAFDSWIVNPDPDFVLSIQTCGARPSSQTSTGTTDDFVCDPSYDRLYQSQLADYDATHRAATTRTMEKRLYDDAYVNVLFYQDQLEAYRDDVIGSIDKQPQPRGILWGQDGYWAFWSATPAAGTTAAGSGGTTFGIVMAVIVVILLAFALFVMRRRRLTEEERE